MRRRELLAGVATFSSAGCLGVLGSEENQYEGEISIKGRNCGEPSHSGNGEVDGQTLSIRGRFGVENVCQTLDYSVFTTANSRTPRRIYVDVTAVDRDVQDCKSCRGTLNYSGEVEFSEEVDVVVLSHVVDNEQIEVSQIEVRPS